MSTLELLVNWVLFILTFMIGYVLGHYRSNPEKLQDLALKIIKKVKRVDVGAVNKPPVPEQLKRGTRLEAEEKEMEKLIETKMKV